MGIKRIRYNKQDKVAADDISKSLGISRFLGEVLTTRNIHLAEQANDFLYGTQSFTDPFTIEDMDKAVDRINKAVDKYESICIYGDYDCDGVCASAILMLYFTDIGANVISYIPHRSEGYGLNKESIKKLSLDGVKLIITVDNGITSVDEVEYAASVGIDVVITDHHQPKEILPNAVAIVDPHRHDCPSEYKHLCGAGVAFKLIAALEGGEYDMVFENYSDIVAIATIGDIVPLIGENRLIVKTGLELLKMTHNPGLIALMDILGLADKPFDARTIAFTVVPRLNVAGRLEHASIALELLLTEDEERAYEIAQQLCNINNKRKEIEKAIQQDIYDEINLSPRIINDSVLVLAKQGWNHGVIGITASKIVEEYSKPCFLMEIKSEDLAVGSGRGVAGISLFDMLCQSDDLLIKYGGHTGAAGLSMNPANLGDIRKRFNQYVNQNMDCMPVDEIVVDKIIDFSELTVQNIDSLKLLEPFGCANEEVVFMLENCLIKSITPIGAGKHLRLNLSKGSRVMNVLVFNMTVRDFSYCLGDLVNVVVSASINEYNGTVSVSLKSKYIFLNGFDEDVYFRSLYIYDRMMRLDGITKEEKEFVLPNREQIGNIYRFLINNPSYSCGYDYIAQKTNSNYAHVRYGLLILKEQGLIKVLDINGRQCIDVVKGAPKVNLDDSKILQRLRSFKYIA